MGRRAVPVPEAHMNMPLGFKIDGADFTSDEDAEALDMIGWGWGAPAKVRYVIGKRVYLDMNDRTVRRLSAFMVN